MKLPFFVATILTLVVPVFGAETTPNLTFKIDADGQNWEKAYEGKLDNLTIVQYIPVGQNLQQWTQLVNVMSYKGLDSDPKKMFSLMTEELKNRLNTNTLHFKVLQEEPNSIIGQWWIQDGTTNDEHSWIKIIKDNDTVVTLLYTAKNGSDAEKMGASWEKILKEATIAK